MTNFKKALQSPYMIVLLFAFKLTVYYILIGATTIDLMTYMILSIILFGTLFIVFSRSQLKNKKSIYLILYSLISLLMFADSMYYNYYNQTVSIKQLWQAANVAAVPDSFVATLIPASFLMFVDIPFIQYYFKKHNNERHNNSWSFRKDIKYLIAGIWTALAILVINPTGNVTMDKINSMEFLTNHIHDIYKVAAENFEAETISAEEVLQVVEEVTPEPEGARLQGLGKDKNLILVQVESLQNFVINASYNGQVLTPNLNSLINGETLYFDHYYSNIGKGNTVDAEFSTLNSLYPVIDRECYTLYEQNTFNGLPWLLRDEGYNAFAIHGYEGEFWNREAAYPYQGFEEFYSMEDLDSSEVIGLGISDKSMFTQAVNIMQQAKEPFFSFIVTLTSHHPYLLDGEPSSLVLKEEHKETKFGAYLQTIRYADEAIGQFINELKEAGLYDDSILVFYGDHHGLNLNMDDNDIIMSEYLGRTYDYDEMLRVPLMIHIPDSGITKTITTTGGQIDFLPTIANLMDLEIEHPYVLGQDLVNADDGFVAFTAYLFDGSFAHNNIMFEISREGIFEGSRAWEIGSQKEVDAALLEEDYNRAIALKQTSKEILEQNLIADYVSHEIEKLDDVKDTEIDTITLSTETTVAATEAEDSGLTDTVIGDVTEDAVAEDVVTDDAVVGNLEAEDMNK